MNCVKRIALMVIRNILLVPFMWCKLCYYAAPRRVMRSGAPGPAPTKCTITLLLYQNGGKITGLFLRPLKGKIRVDPLVRQTAVAHKCAFFQLICLLQGIQ